MELLIRRMRQEDLDEAAALEAANFSRPWKREDFAVSLDMKERIYSVACLEGKVVALAGLICSAPDAELVNVSVDSTLRGQGIAAALLKYLFDEAAACGISDIVLEVRSKNTPAIKLYEKLGFKQEGFIRRFYTDPLDDGLIYWLRKDS